MKLTREEYLIATAVIGATRSTNSAFSSQDGEAELSSESIDAIVGHIAESVSPMQLETLAVVVNRARNKQT